MRWAMQSENCQLELANVWVGDNVSLNNLSALIDKRGTIDFLRCPNRLATEPSANAVWANRVICENATPPCAQFAHCGSVSNVSGQCDVRQWFLRFLIHSGVGNCDQSGGCEPGVVE